MFPFDDLQMDRGVDAVSNKKNATYGFRETSSWEEERHAFCEAMSGSDSCDSYALDPFDMEEWSPHVEPPCAVRRRLDDKDKPNAAVLDAGANLEGSKERWE